MFFVLNVACTRFYRAFMAFLQCFFFFFFFLGYLSQLCGDFTGFRGFRSWCSGFTRNEDSVFRDMYPDAVTCSGLRIGIRS